MQGKHPKRKKDKYNPYVIYKKEGQAFLSFKDGQGNGHTLEINKGLYEVFNLFELQDIKYLNVLSRHIEHSEVWDSTLNRRALEQPESTEEIVIKKIQKETLHRAICELPQIQKRRLVLYYFENMTYEQIAKLEGCSKVAVKYTIDKAIKNLKKFFV